MKPTLVILAAGMGSRYGGLKQIDPVGPSGEAIIDYSVFDAVRAGFEKIVFVIRKDIEAEFKESIGDKYRKVVQVEYVYQELNGCLPDGFAMPEGRVKPWGTGHAILVAKDAVDGPFAVINADDFYGRSTFELIFKYLSGYRLPRLRSRAMPGKQASGYSKNIHKSLISTESQATSHQPRTPNHESRTTSHEPPVTSHEPRTYCMVGFALEDTLSEFGSVSRGICSCDADNNLVGVVERTEIKRTKDGVAYFEDDKAHSLTGEEIVSTNVWGFTPSIFDYLDKMFKEFIATRGAELKGEFYLPYVVNELIKNGIATVKVMKSPGPWFGVTYKEDKPQVIDGIKKLVEQGDYPEKLY